MIGSVFALTHILGFSFEFRKSLNRIGAPIHYQVPHFNFTIPIAMNETLSAEKRIQSLN